MLKFLKALNRKLDELLYSATPRKYKIEDNFAFKDDEEKNEIYDEILDTKRSICSSNPFFKIFIISWVVAIIWFVGAIIFLFLFR
jgi:hypothetical protein